ncbi:keratin, type I cytoskeletal 42-like [Denticeps clupeoides]|uniref:IF rod domain-containing protein n=1 Tax=Denticeps clupeoides TaxID=299321 RepID=A0AAY4DI81_9TELE|nr:keratin, type I cytoskeletal 42-like [Denticeps clupeoides]
MSVRVNRQGSRSGTSGAWGRDACSYRTHSFPASSVTDAALTTNEKLTMQNLNDRLATYLEKVRTLEAANNHLELKIKEFFQNRSPVHNKDLSAYRATSEDLIKQILENLKDNSQTTLQIDNARLAGGDYQKKYENEMNMRLATEADVTHLKRVQSDLQLSCTDLELQLKGLNEELVFLKRDHQQELQMLRDQQCGSVDVQVEAGASVDLNKVLQDMREQYETVIQRNRRDAELWFQGKVEILQREMVTNTTDIKTSKTELSDLNRSHRNLEIELQGSHTLKEHLEQQMGDVQGRYGAQLALLQQRVDALQAELQQLSGSIRQQASEYQLLLDIKMRLQLEIAEYRRLLEGEGFMSSSNNTGLETTMETTTMNQTSTKEIEEEEDEHNPHRQRRVKIIVEEMVDGVVVSSSVDERVQEVAA